MRNSIGKKYYEVSTNINAKDYLATFHYEILVSTNPLNWLEFEYSFLEMIKVLNARADYNQVIDIDLSLKTARDTFKNLQNKIILVEEIDKLFEILFPYKFEICIYAYIYIVELQHKQFAQDKSGNLPWFLRPQKEKCLKRGVKFGKQISNIYNIYNIYIYI